MMQIKLYVLTLIAYYWTEAAPIGLGTLQFDKLDTNLSDLSYNIEEEDLDDFSKLLDYSESEIEPAPKPKIDLKTSGFKKKKTANKLLKGQQNIDDLKDFYKRVGVHDQGDYDDDDIYAVAEGVAAMTVGGKINEDRKYKKGTKTRGFHKVHHKDEYKKEKEFYEDDETNGNVRKIAAKGVGLRVGGGVANRRRHFHNDHNKGLFGKQGYSDRLSFDKRLNGYSDSQGFDAKFSNDK